jgi:hypothetical protein
MKLRGIISQFILDWPAILVELALATALILGRKSNLTAPIVACLFVGWMIVRRIRRRKYRKSLE